MRKSALAAGGAALALALAGCGGDNAASGEFFGNIEQLANSASIQTTETGSSKITLEMSVMGQQITGEGKASYGADPAMTLTMSAMGQATEMRMVDNTIYMKMPPQQAQAMGADTPWVSMSPGQGLPAGQMAQQSDPTKVLDTIKQSGAEITASETAMLNGEEVSRYTVTLDPMQALEMSGNTQLTEQQKQQFAQRMSEVGPVPMEIDLNSANLPVRIAMDMKQIAEAGGMPGEVSMTMTFSDWGTPVEVEAPPRDQVTEIDAPSAGGF
ncbi:hypothetical protein [Saccharomonospora saliphila]|uniref:hypothetical protein n=1 Tax=Saccharomonospora saliphila TaxID=369829 RepID=UPI0003649D95|nr:hypothetical protein [Saccharomonospora saliphila]